MIGFEPATGICDESTLVTVNGSLIDSVAFVTPVTTTALSSVRSFFRLKSSDCAPGLSEMGLADG